MAEEHLPVVRERAISELAEFVAEEYCPLGSVEPLTILREKKITHSSGFYGSHFDSMLDCRNGSFHVYTNLERLGSPSSPRARFTLGHELGHYFIDDHRNALLAGVEPHGSRCDYESRNLVEQEADLFASHLLLPESRFKAAAARLPVGFGAILSMANQFGTSFTATAIRYVLADLIPCTVIKWSVDGFGWKWFSRSTFEAGIWKTIEERSRLPTDSATEEAFRVDSPMADRVIRRGSTAATWFPFITTGSARNAILIEEAIPLGRFGVLTLLYPEGGSYGSTR